MLAKPDVQLRHADDVPEGVIAIGDAGGRLKQWFSRLPQSVVLLRPDRFVAGVCSPQQVSEAITELAGKLGMTTAPVYADAGSPCVPSRPAPDPVTVTQAAGA